MDGMMDAAAADEIVEGQQWAFLGMMPQPLRNRLQGSSGAELIQTLLQHGMGHPPDEAEALMAGNGTMEDLARISSEQFLSAFTPIAQEEMVTMNQDERRQVMEWLSNPAPIAEAMRDMIEQLLGSDEAAQAVTHAAFQVASNLENADELLQGITQEDLVEELNQLKEALQQGEQGPSRRDIAQRQRHAREVAEAAAAAAHTAQIGGASSSSSSAAPVKSSRRSSGRLAEKRHSDPLEVLDEDSLRLVFRGLDCKDLDTLQKASKQWMHAVRSVVRSAAWRQEFGCIVPSEGLYKIVTESGVARLALQEQWTNEDVESIVNPALDKSTLTDEIMLKRCDGPSVGPVSKDHVVMIVGKRDGYLRFDIGKKPYMPGLPTNDNVYTRLRLLPLPTNRGGIFKHAEHATELSKKYIRHHYAFPPVLCYGEELRIIMDNQTGSAFHLRKIAQVPCDTEQWSTRFCIKPVEAAQSEAGPS